MEAEPWSTIILLYRNAKAFIKHCFCIGKSYEDQHLHPPQILREWIGYIWSWSFVTRLLYYQISQLQLVDPLWDELSLLSLPSNVTIIIIHLNAEFRLLCLSFPFWLYLIWQYIQIGMLPSSFGIPWPCSLKHKNASCNIINCHAR